MSCKVIPGRSAVNKLALVRRNGGCFAGTCYPKQDVAANCNARSGAVANGNQDDVETNSRQQCCPGVNGPISPLELFC